MCRLAAVACAGEPAGDGCAKLKLKSLQKMKEGEDRESKQVFMMSCHPCVTHSNLWFMVKDTGEEGRLNSHISGVKADSQ